jgi:hypothetical protein
MLCLFTSFICILPHDLHTDIRQRQTLTVAYEQAIHDRGRRQITFYITHCAYSYNQYINQQMHFITYNSRQLPTATCYGTQVQSAGNLSDQRHTSPSWEANCSQLVKKFTAFYTTRRFITALTSACLKYCCSKIHSVDKHTITVLWY